ncbi:PTS sugar transporter subunit IIA, partial [Enterococcus cecorum]
MDLVLNEQLVFRDLKVKTQEEVLDCLSNKLLELGFVKDEYVEAIKQREKEYPTGLPSTEPVVAIPHANYEMVDKTTLAIATLKEPILFE